ncbi:hypothetical protein EXS54_01770 [Patescibacteria group bacterium]|nr:hypothetical protein [Patescibacteria group bacterium]
MRLARIFENRTQRQQLFAYVILGATVGVMIATVLPSLNGHGYLAAWDAGGHLLKAHYFAQNLLPLGHLSGWFPIWHGGFDLFQFYPPLLYYLLGPLSILLKPELALRIVTAALWIGLVPVTYYFLRSFKLNRLIAALGTSFLLSLNASFGIGLGALYGVGLLPNGLGAILAIWAMGRLKRDLSWPNRGVTQVVLTGLIVGLLILAHTFSAYWWIAASLFLVASEIIGRRERVAPVLKRYGLILGIGLLISVYWWIPLIFSLDNMGTTGAIQQSSRGLILKGLLFSEDSGGWVMSVLALGGLVYLGFRKSWRTLGFLLGAGVFSLLLSLDTINDILPFGSVVGSSQFIRFHAFFAWLMMVWAAFGLAGIWWLLRRIKEPRWLAPICLAALMVVTISLVILPTLEVKRGFVRIIDNGPSDELAGVATYLKANEQPGDFILSEFNWDSRFFFGSPHFVNQHLPMLDENIWDMDGNFPEGTPGSAQPVLVASVMANADYLRSQQDYLASRGVRYLVSTHPATRSVLESEPWLKLVHASTVLSVFEIVGPRHSFGLPTDQASKLTTVTYTAPGTYQLKFSELISLPVNTLLALSAHPWLKASADGKNIPIGKDTDGRLRLKAAVGPFTELTITYEPPWYVRGAAIISVLALLGVILILARRKWANKMLGAIKQSGKRVRHVARRRPKKRPAR